MSTTLKAYCSWCGKFSEHRLVETNYLSRNEYWCVECGQRTVICIAFGCSNMAKYEPEYSGKDSVLSSAYKGVANWFKGDCYCGEHDGSLADFSKLNDTLDDLKNYKEMFERRCTNLNSITTVGAFVLASAAIMTPVSWLAAPKLAA